MKSAVDHADEPARAERHIAGVEERIARQLACIERMAARGHDTADPVLAQAALRVLGFGLEAPRQRRRFSPGEPGVPARRSRPHARVRRPRRATASPRSDERGRETPWPAGGYLPRVRC